VCPSEPIADVFPPDIQRLLTFTGLPASLGGTLVRDYRIASAGDLATALEDRRFADTPLASRVAAFAQALPTLRADDARLGLGRAWTIAAPLTSELADADPDLLEIETAGSLRRFAAAVGDIEILGASTNPSRTIARVQRTFGNAAAHAVTSDTLLLTRDRQPVLFRAIAAERWGAAMLHHTGSRSHVRALRSRATDRGWRLSADALHDQLGRLRDTRSETELYALFDLPLIAPELREDGSEIDAAEAGRLPGLVQQADIRGDLHMHSDWSDGRDSVETMVAAARSLGYEYVALTDHSGRSSVANGLDPDRLERQRDAIAAVREIYPDITVLHGAEVDILEDGSLDYPDAVLARLDVVLASLHEHLEQDGARLTDRYCRAMRHPLVQIVTHPTNRVVPHRRGYDLDEERLFATAAETGTFLEIDGAPGHLDMDGAMARRAIAAGVDVAIDGDCHRAEWLGRQMQFGVATARRGWVEARHVLNTRPLAEMRALLHRKR
jgi:DNA polymerase (family X)